MRKAACGALTLALTLVAAGCGSASSTPSYCTHVDNLKASVKALPNTDVVHNGLNALETSLTKIKTDAQAVVSSAKSDFPTETSALHTSVDALSTTVKSAVSSPSASSLAQIPGQVSAVITAAKNLESATKSKCS
jgi:Spy/CpxP family protein refolding chaperone